MQHVEFFHRDHFEYNYHRKKAKKSLSQFIDFFWEIRFDHLWEQYPDGFSDALFPNIGYTYLINLGTPFVMQLEKDMHPIKSDAFLPRYKNIICHHTPGNKIFGIKFKVSPVILQKKINFSEYKEYIFPLAYLIEPAVVDRIKGADSFTARVEVISAYYDKIIHQYTEPMQQVNVVTRILKECDENNRFFMPIEILAKEAGISSRTLQRYFEATTSINSKQALQIMRIRKAVQHMTTSPADFHYSTYGYYDQSHFHKHLKGFINQHTIDIIQPHLQLLKGIRP
ncbi:MAG TPA: helix-turn-helix domain-containing protein [Flavisolibacter sp.]